MRPRWMIALLVGAAAISIPASAQQSENLTGIPTETQRRMAQGEPDTSWLDLIGLIGLLGLAGLRRDSDNDGYTADPI